MCTVVLLKDVVPGMPVVLAANRDEFFERPSAGPDVLDPDLGIVGGRDLQAGGTWLAVTASGFFVALTNLPDHGADIRGLQSRGHVVLEVARAGARGGPAAARAWLEAADPQSTRPYHLLFGDRHTVYVAGMQASRTLSEVSSGIHVLPNGPLNDARFPKVGRIRKRLSSAPREWTAMRTALWAALADDTIPPDAPPRPGVPFPPEVQAALQAVWVRLPMYGTRSSSLVGLSDAGAVHYEFIDGPPSESPVDHSHLLVAQAAWPTPAVRDAVRGVQHGFAPAVDWQEHTRQAVDGVVDTVSCATHGPVPVDAVEACLAELEVDGRLLRRALALIPATRCRLGFSVRWSRSGMVSARVRFGDLPAHFDGVQGARRLLALATVLRVALPPDLSAPGVTRAVSLVLHTDGAVGLAVERAVPADVVPPVTGWSEDACEVRVLRPTDGPLVGCRHEGPATARVASSEWWPVEPGQPGIEVDAAGDVVGRWEQLG